ncbi:MAG: hypothetical protein QM756_25285 [Polyangiaceae bacterium]
MDSGCLYVAAASLFIVLSSACAANNSEAKAASEGGSASGGASATSGGALASGGKQTTSATTCPSNALFCEDFERGTLDGWNTLLTSGTLELSSAQAASGNGALSITIPPNQRGGFIERAGAPLFPLPKKALWGRLMVYFDGVSDGHTDIVRGAASGGGTPWYNVGEQHGEIMLNYYSGAADCWARPSPGKVVAQHAWTCWEWGFDGSTNELRFFIDGTLSRSVSVTGDGCLSGEATPWAAPEFGSLRIGAYIAELRDSTMQVYIDDVAVGTDGRLGCPVR